MKRIIELYGQFNRWLAVRVTGAIASMTCAYLFAALALYGLTGVHRNNPFEIVSWVSQTFLQLVLLSIIMVGQSVLAKASDLQAREMHDAVLEELQDAREARQALLELNTNLLAEMAEIKAMHTDLDLFLKQAVTQEQILG